MIVRALGVVGLLVAAAGALAQAPPRYESWTWPARPLPERPLPESLAADTLTAPDDPWLGRDKVLHAAGSFLMTLSAQYVLTNKAEMTDGEAFPVAAASVLALGVTKELLDSRRRVQPLFSFRDLAADAAGVLLAAAVIAL